MDLAPPADRSSDFGARLKRLREERGVELRDIAETTKISVSALEALERDDISRLPGGIFSRGFVRAYAEQIGADPEKTVNDFIARFPQASVSDGGAHLAGAVDTDPPSQLGRRLVIALVLLLPVAAIVIWTIVTRN